MTRSLSELCRRVSRRLFSAPAKAAEPTRLGIEALEARLCPVVGGYNIPAPIDVGAGYDGVARLNKASGALLSTARHVLTAGHVSYNQNADTFVTAPTRFMVDSPTGPRAVNMPGAKFNVPQELIDGDWKNYDIGVMTLAELGPLNAERYSLYQGSDEVGKVGRIVGYGATGTGTSGMATDINPLEVHPTDIGTGTNYELVRFTIHGNPSTGHFIPYLSNSVGNGQYVPLGSGVNGLRDALLAMPGVTNVQVRVVGDSTGDGRVDNWYVPHAGAYEALFLGVNEAHKEPGEGANTINHSMADVVVFDNFPGADQYVEVETILQGGTKREKRTALNGITKLSATGAELLADFDNGFSAGNSFGDGTGQGVTKEGFGSFGDSGSPLFVDGKIAGVAVHLIGDGGFDGNFETSDFGDQMTWTRVEFHREFLNSVIFDDASYDLVLNMNNQPWGKDGIDDNIRVNVVNGQLRILIDGVVRYQDELSSIKSVRVQGSSDNETISVEDLGANTPVSVLSGDGNDVIRVVGLAYGASLSVNGGAGDDLVAVGAGFLDLGNNIHGSLSVFDGSGSDTIEFRDQNGTGVGVDYALQGWTFTHSGMPDPVVYWGFDTVKVLTGTKPSNVNIGSSTAQNVQVTGGPAADWFRITSGTIGSTNFTLTGGGGADELAISDAQSNTARTHRLFDDNYLVSGMAGHVNYASFAAVNLYGGQQNDRIELHSGKAGVNYVLSGNGGNDDFLLTNGLLDQIQGAVTIYGGTGNNDTVTLNDTAEFEQTTYTVTAFGVSHGTFSVGMLGIDAVALNSSAANNTFQIRGTPALTTINAGEGKDVFQLSPTEHDLGDLTRGLILNGQGGDDTMVADDRNSAGTAVYTLTGATLTRDGFAGVLFDGLEDVVLRLSDNDNTVKIYGAKAGTDVTIDGNGGNDTFRVTDSPKSKVTLNGGTGYDRVSWMAKNGFAFLDLNGIEKVEFPLFVG